MADDHDHAAERTGLMHTWRCHEAPNGTA
jgi:hypothetical protein